MKNVKQTPRPIRAPKGPMQNLTCTTLPFIGALVDTRINSAVRLYASAPAKAVAGGIMLSGCTYERVISRAP